MIPGFRSVTKRCPCPICGKPDWCVVSSDGTRVGCQRVESSRTFGKAGWLHILSKPDAGARHYYEPRQVVINAKQIHESYRDAIATEDVAVLADNLGVSHESLDELGVGRAKEYRPGTYSFPMRNGAGEIVGIRLRNLAGKKWAVLGSKSGLFFNPLRPIEDCVFVCEGPTSSAALLTVGLFAIGKPSNLAGMDHLHSMLKSKKVARAVVMAEMDGRDHCDFCDENFCQHCKPGEYGAYATADRISDAVQSVVVVHPLIGKDVRDWVRAGATKQTLMEAANAI